MTEMTTIPREVERQRRLRSVDDIACPDCPQILRWLRFPRAAATKKKKKKQSRLPFVHMSKSKGCYWLREKKEHYKGKE